MPMPSITSSALPSPFPVPRDQQSVNGGFGWLDFSLKKFGFDDEKVKS
jgi:hypothetical protein